MNRTGYITGPFQGVSQAPPQVRLPGTCEAAVNTIPWLPFGSSVRPPLVYQHEVLSADADNTALVQRVSTSQGEMELIINQEAGSNEVYLRDLTGADIPVTVSPAAQTYLDANGATPAADLRAFTIEDTTFLLNTLKPTALGATTAPTRPYEALIWIRQGNYGQQYTVTIGATTATWKTANGDSGDDNFSIACDEIAYALYNGVKRPASPASGAVYSGTAGGLSTLTGAGYTVTLRGSLLYISHPSTDFTIAVDDDNGGVGIKAFKESVQRFSDLPSLAEDGFTVRIAQEAAGGNSDYWVEFQATSSTNQGVWQEVLAPGTNLGLDPLTLPVVLTYSAGWAIDTAPWLGRTVGDTEHAPDPGFTGQTLNGVSWFKGRLAILYDGGMQLTGSDNPYKLYTTTLATAIDSDPIGLLNPASARSAFKYAVAFDEGRQVLLGPDVFALLAADRQVTASTVGLDGLGDQMPFNAQCPPFAIGRRIYFSHLTSEGLQVSELAVDRLSGGDVDEPMTAGVPAYLPTTLNRACGLRDAFMGFYGTSGGSRLYIHNARYANQERVQNAWHHWELPEDLELCHFYARDYVLHLFMVTTAGALVKFTIDLAPQATDYLAPHGLIHMDWRILGTEVSSAYDAGTELTTVTGFPTGAAPTVASVIAPTADYAFGYLPEVTGGGPTSLVLRGDWTGTALDALAFGRPYDAYVTLTAIYPLGQDQKPEWQGELRLQKLYVDLLNTSAVHVTASGVSKVLDGPLDLDAAIGQQAQVLEVPMNGIRSSSNPITIRNTGCLGFTLVGLEWSGDWTPRAARKQ